MFSTLASLQEEVVNAFLDSVEEAGDWRAAFVHAEFADGASLSEGFLVRDGDAPDFLPLATEVGAALDRLHAGYAAAGQGFARLDLTIAAPDGRYRFAFGDAPSLRLAGQRDPCADAHLDRQFAALKRSA